MLYSGPYTGGWGWGVEGSFSCTQFLQRASMTEQRLTGLALMHIHYDIKVDLELVVDNFAKRNPRKMELKNLIFDC